MFKESSDEASGDDDTPIVKWPAFTDIARIEDCKSRINIGPQSEIIKKMISETTIQAKRNMAFDNMYPETDNKAGHLRAIMVAVAGELHVKLRERLLQDSEYARLCVGIVSAF